MSARLVPLSTGPRVPPILVQRPVLMIGRHPECDVRFDVPQVSRRHCCLAQANDRLTIRDLGSRHGVRVNGRVVGEARLEAGDEIAIAHLLFRLEVEVASTSSAPPPPPPPAATETTSPAPLLQDPPDRDDDPILLLPLDD